MHAELRGIRHYYEVSGEGTPVLLIMGFGFSGKAWRPQVTALEKQHQVAWFDNRGVGQSDTRGRSYTMGDLADDAAALLDHLKWTAAHVVGVSMGGMIAQELSLRHTARIKSLTLIATMTGSVLGKLPTGRGLRLFARAQSSKGALRLETLTELLYPAGQGPEAGVVQPGFDKPPVPRTVFAQLGAIAFHDTRKRLKNLERVPTLILKPELDILVRPKHSDALHRMIPGSKLVSFADTGHAITTQRASEVNAELLAHFKRAEAR